MSKQKQKPDSFYHMSVCKYAAEGYRKTKDGPFQGEDGTFMENNDHLVFVGWSGRVVVVPLHAH